MKRDEDKPIMDDIEALRKENEEMKARLEKLKADVSNAEYELDRSVPVHLYTDLERRYNDLKDESADMSKELTALRTEVATLCVSNQCMEAELKRVRESRDSLAVSNAKLDRDLQYLRSQSLWERIFNR